MKWQCTICGWIYDESKGDDETGLTAGTLFADIPDSWSCPLCCAGKESFVQI